MTATVTIERPQSTASDTIARAVHTARQRGQPVLVTCVEQLPFAPDPLAFLAASSAVLGKGILWEQDRIGQAFASAGAAFDIQANGPGRFGAISMVIRNLRHVLVRDDGDDAKFPVLGGFAFGERVDDSELWRGFPDGRMVVPRVLLQNEGDRALIRVSLQVDPGASTTTVGDEMRDLFDQARTWTCAPSPMPSSHADGTSRSIPERRAWESSVATAIALIRQSMLDKVVLAREERVHHDAHMSPFAALAHLRSFDPEATLFAMQTGDAWFIGATPERLVRLDDGRVDVTCLAGSIASGRNAAEQAENAMRLLASAKDREEHEIVVRSTMAALAEVCEDVTRLEGTPRVVAARSVQHLETPLSGRLSSAGHVLDLVERLHPTPAVGGYPREPALTLIRELEEIDRGWYAGPFGWTDLDGSGEFAVALRSALLAGRTASLFAGCGIVADSDPAAEYEETCLKLRPMLAALGAT